MSKLTVRQIIILSAMAVIIFFAVWDFLLAPSKSEQTNIEKRSTELYGFLADISAKLPRGPLSAVDAYVLNRAESGWVRDPFYERKTYREWERRKERPTTGGGLPQKVSFSYSGYVRVGNKNLAIINGVEYRAGDPLEIEGYVLKDVYPGKVVIVNKKTGARFDVPLQD